MHPCPLLHSSLLAQRKCPSLVSDQWHSVAGHKILLFRCHHSLTLGRILVPLWCWKGLPSGRWWWACWRLGNIQWVFMMSVWTWNPIPCSCLFSFPLKKPCILPLLLFHQSSSISFYSPQMFHLYLSIWTTTNNKKEWWSPLVGSGQVLWTCTGMNKTLPPSMSLSAMGEIAGVNMALLGGWSVVIINLYCCCLDGVMADKTACLEHPPELSEYANNILTSFNILLLVCWGYWKKHHHHPKNKNKKTIIRFIQFPIKKSFLHETTCH